MENITVLHCSFTCFWIAPQCVLMFAMETMCKTRDYMLFMLQYREARFEMIFYHCIRQDCQKCCNKFFTAVRNEQYWCYNMVYKYSDSTLGNDATRKVCNYNFFQDKMYTACYVFQLRIVTMQIFDDLWTPAISAGIYLQKVKNLLLSWLPSRVRIFISYTIFTAMSGMHSHRVALFPGPA